MLYIYRERETRGNRKRSSDRPEKWQLSVREKVEQANTRGPKQGIVCVSEREAARKQESEAERKRSFRRESNERGSHTHARTRARAHTHTHTHKHRVRAWAPRVRKTAKSEASSLRREGYRILTATW